MHRALLCALLAIDGAAKDDGLARTPPMGWSSWNCFRTHVDEAKMIAAADALVDSGLAALGYTVVWIDAGWWKTEWAIVNGTNASVAARNATGFLVADALKFPRGIRAVSDHARARGLTYGHYTDGGHKFCTGELRASAGYEPQDAALFAAWGADALKIDHCDAGTADGDIPASAQPATMERWSALLDASGRDVLVQNCGVGCAPGLAGHDRAWGGFCNATAHFWRVGRDIEATWARVMAGLDLLANMTALAGPGGWNYPDSLEVGNPGLTLAEARGHFALWCVASSPLILGHDLSNMSADVLSIVGNAEAVAVNQAWAGSPGYRAAPATANDRAGAAYAVEVWTKPLPGDERAAVLLNRDAADGAARGAAADGVVNVTFAFADASLSCDVRDLDAREDLGCFEGGFTAALGLHEARFIVARSCRSAPCGEGREPGPLSDK